MRNLTRARTMLAALIIGCLASSSACLSSARPASHESVAIEAPPATPPAGAHDPTSAPPGYVWIQGRWAWDGRAGAWEWHDGYWTLERNGFDVVAGHWERRGDGYTWIEPRWVDRSDPHRTITIDDHGRATGIRVDAEHGDRPGARRLR